MPISRMALLVGGTDVEGHADASEKAAEHDVEHRAVHHHTLLHIGGYEAHGLDEGLLGGIGLAHEEHRRRLAPNRLDLLGKQLDQRRLARAVGSEHDDVLALVDDEVIDVEDYTAVHLYFCVMKTKQFLGHGGSLAICPMHGRVPSFFQSYRACACASESIWE